MNKNLLLIILCLFLLGAGGSSVTPSGTGGGISGGTIQGDVTVTGSISSGSSLGVQGAAMSVPNNADGSTVSFPTDVGGFFQYDNSFFFKGSDDNTYNWQDPVKGYRYDRDSVHSIDNVIKKTAKGFEHIYSAEGEEYLKWTSGLFRFGLITTYHTDSPTTPTEITQVTYDGEVCAKMDSTKYDSTISAAGMGVVDQEVETTGTVAVDSSAVLDWTKFNEGDKPITLVWEVNFPTVTAGVASTAALTVGAGTPFGADATDAFIATGINTAATASYLKLFVKQRSLSVVTVASTTTVTGNGWHTIKMVLVPPDEYTIYLDGVQVFDEGDATTTDYDAMSDAATDDYMAVINSEGIFGAGQIIYTKSIAIDIGE